ncbi:hypothetical protein LCGC14_0671490 [marine sediment metagenome]|uniref:DNA N-6-adenine-methyltransferase (Dam) n=1 Tax=marine sediment metagenome TaxID=412755 RepID=A0A0F9QQS7_9ZZZZ
MTHNFNTNTLNNDEWLTPLDLIKAVGPFDLDPCAPIVRPWDTAKNHYTVEDNGLDCQWTGRVWLNPPYGRETWGWLKKLADHKNGLALIFARTETIGFHKEIWEKAHSIFFFKGRLRFYYVSGKKGGVANAPSCLISYNEFNSKVLKNTSLKGKHVLINPRSFLKPEEAYRYEYRPRL